MANSRRTASKRCRRRRRNGCAFLFVMSLVVAVVFLAVFWVQIFKQDIPKTPSFIASPLLSPLPSPQQEPQESPTVLKATLAVTGDLLMHEPIIANSRQSDGSYDFDPIFAHFGRYISQADYAVANLETTLRGEADGYSYAGYPQFNCPDSIVAAAKNAGFDMLLTANNHAYDTRYRGMMRTLEVIDANGMDRLGIVRETEEKRYLIKNINGIRIGMLCYTYETDPSAGKVALNGIPLSEEAAARVNAFSYKELDSFYTRIGGQINAMKAEGAEAIVLFIHWGEEYKLTVSQQQRAIAQKLCNLGIDVIAGGHPHVMEPAELLSSETDSSHKTVCVYSLGNAISNQRRDRMRLKTGHTEDGALFRFTFAKYSDGTVLLEDADLLPIWADMFVSQTTGKRVYQIIPLDVLIMDWKKEFGLTDAREAEARNSYARTLAITGEGMEQIRRYLHSDENSYPIAIKAAAA